MKLIDMTVLIRGGGDIGSGVAWRLHMCGFRVLIAETSQPLCVRRKVSFCEAVYEGTASVEGTKAVLVQRLDDAGLCWEKGQIPVFVDPELQIVLHASPQVLVDAILAKKNLGTSIGLAPLVIALGPGFEAGKDAHFVVETNRGHCLGRILTRGSAEPDTGVPGKVMGIGSERVLRSPADGLWESSEDIGRIVRKGDMLGNVSGRPLIASIDGVIRGLIRPGIRVSKGLKMGDIDPRGIVENCFTVSDKALAIAGGVLEGILRHYGRALA
ncbi:MAG: EF2563 family selenium-dependent molybdenum hydroxylase system protein [Desulfobacteraceae bacterium]|nr:MAG: EF2563 family selenium-dependent molybdenum hydroxylase system protein [Desulfobacteraceae bacterium]